jgi:hypothetical protein
VSVSTAIDAAVATGDGLLGRFDSDKEREGGWTGRTPTALAATSAANIFRETSSFDFRAEIGADGEAGAEFCDAFVGAGDDSAEPARLPAALSPSNKLPKPPLTAAG